MNALLIPDAIGSAVAITGAHLLRRGLDVRVNSRSAFMWTHFFSINLLFRKEVLQRRDFPLGDEAFAGPLLKSEQGDALLRQRAV